MDPSTVSCVAEASSKGMSLLNRRVQEIESKEEVKGMNKYSNYVQFHFISELHLGMRKIQSHLLEKTKS